MKNFVQVGDILDAIAPVGGVIGGNAYLLAERLILGEQTDDELPPNGQTFFITFTIRVRSSDALGRTP